MRKVGVIGAGYFGQFHINAWQRLNVDLVGICDTGKTEHLSSLDALLERGPDIIDITTPPATHLDLIGKLDGKVDAIICQKPFCDGLEAAIKAVETTRQSRLFVHENIRFQPWYAAMKTALDQGMIGTPYHATFRARPGDGQGPDAYLSRQPYFQTMPRFFIHETGIHWIDTLRYLFGDIKSLSAFLIRRNQNIAGEDGALVQFEFEAGQTALLDGNRLADHAAENTRLTLGEMLIEGSTGSLSLTGDGRVTHRAMGELTTTDLQFDWQDRDFGGDCVMRTCAHLLDAIETGAPSDLDAASYLINQQIEEAVYQSAASGQRVEMPSS